MHKNQFFYLSLDSDTDSDIENITYTKNKKTKQNNTGNQNYNTGNINNNSGNMNNYVPIALSQDYLNKVLNCMGM